MSYQEVNFHSDDEDILLPRRNQSDLRWAAQEWEADSVYKYKREVDIKELINNIKNSDRIKLVMEKLNSNGHGSSNYLNDRIDQIIQEMAHTLDISVIRKFALILPKIMKTIYGQIFVNRSGIQKLKSILKETPVILLPTHRSYADFILISYIAFHYYLPFPVIAAGIDFMSMSVIGSMLRGAGAFYIKRSFMNDELYSAVFHEYVQNIFCYSGHPMEFFLEGTRSRSGKSLPPKLGLLNCITECWLRAKVPDILIVPVSISYNRTLEESLYAYEMLGVPKPKESTSGLLKGMKILKEDYGNIYVHFGTAISASSFLNCKVNRTIASANPPHLIAPTKEELYGCESLALHVLKQLQNNWVVSIWSLCCIALLDVLWQGHYSIPFNILLERTNILVTLAVSLQTRIECFDENEVEKCLRKSMITHHNLVSVDRFDIVRLRSTHQGNSTTPESKMKLNEISTNHAVFHLHLQHYVNQGIHIFIQPALVAFSLTNETKSYELAKRKFSLLCKLFAQDFIFEKEKEDSDFKIAMRFLIRSSVVVECDDGLKLKSDPSSTSFSVGSYLLGLLSPFVLCYSVAVQISIEKKIWKCEQELVSCLQESLQPIVEDCRIYSSLSVDTCRNAVRSLLKLDGLKKISYEGEKVLQSNPSKLLLISDILDNSPMTKRMQKSKL